MAAAVRTFLTLLFVARVRSNLLPVDLSGISPASLLHLGLDTPQGGLLGGLGQILSSGVGTVGSLGKGILGKVTALTLEHQSDLSSDTTNINPWSKDLSYAAYWKNTHKESNQNKHVSYGEWINNIHGDFEHPSRHYNGYSRASTENHVTKPTLDDQVLTTNKPVNDNKENHVYLDKEPIIDGTNNNKVLISTETSLNVNDAIIFPDSGEIMKLISDETRKPESARDVIVPQYPNVDVTTTKPVNENNQVVILQPGNQPTANGIYVLPSGSSFGSQDINGVPKIPTVYVDNEGRKYYVIQSNMNQVNQPVQPIKVTTPANIQTNNQGYILMNINGQQVLVPVSSLAMNGLPIDINVKPNPKPQGQMYVFIPNNGQNNMPYNPSTVQNPIISYVTTPKYVSFEKAPVVTEMNDPHIPSDSRTKDFPNAVENTNGSEVEDTEGKATESLSDIDIRK